MNMNGIDFLELAKDADTDVSVGRLFKHAELLEKYPVLTESFENEQLVVALWDAPICGRETLIAGDEYEVFQVGTDSVQVTGKFSRGHGGRTVHYDASEVAGFDPRRVFMPANFKFEDLEVGMTLRPTHRFCSYHVKGKCVLPERTYKVDMVNAHIKSLGGAGIRLSGQFEGADNVRDLQWFGVPKSPKEKDTLAIPIQCAFTIEKAAPLPPEQQTLLDSFKALAETPEGKAVFTELFGS